MQIDEKHKNTMQRNDYYQIPEVLYEIVKCLKARETAFLGINKNIRCIKAHSVEFLKTNMQNLGFFNEPYNIYYSLASLNNMPVFTFNLKKRIIQQNEFNKEFKKYVIGYDIGMDFDAHHYDSIDQKSIIIPYQELYDDVKKTKDLFDEYNLPYSLKVSGSGFHINIADWVFNNEKDKPLFARKFIDTLKIILNIRSLDVSTPDLRRVWKVPYSFDSKTGNIALPLDDTQFQNFNYGIVNPGMVIDNGIRNRGIMQRKGTIKNFQEFINDYISPEDEKEEVIEDSIQEC